MHVEYDETPKGHEVHANDRVTASAALDYTGKNTKTKIVLDDGVCDLEIRVDNNGGLDLGGVLVDKKGKSTQLQTEGSGQLEARVPRGRYKVRFGEHKDRKVAIRAQQFESKP